MSSVLRLEEPGDHRRVEELTREAFWGYMNPTCDEHYLVHLLRQSPAFIPELDYVALFEDKLVGNIMYTRAKIIDAWGVARQVLTFGPLSVLPDYWNKGVGTALVEETAARAREMGYPGIIIYGHPDYYPRFGFRNAGAFGITTPRGKNFDALMALPLSPGGLAGLGGAFYEDPVYSLDAVKAAAFDRSFPAKDPAQLPSVEILLAKLSPAAAEAISSRGLKNLTDFHGYSGREILGWEGIDRNAFAVINEVLVEWGIPGKLQRILPF